MILRHKIARDRFRKFHLYVDFSEIVNMHSRMLVSYITNNAAHVWCIRLYNIFSRDHSCWLNWETTIYCLRLNHTQWHSFRIFNSKKILIELLCNDYNYKLGIWSNWNHRQCFFLIWIFLFIIFVTPCVSCFCTT